MKIKFNNNNYTFTQLVRNIKNIYSQTESKDRFNWYSQALQTCIMLRHDTDTQSTYTIAQVVGMCAALSIRKSWKTNIELLQDALNDKPIKHTNIVRLKVQQIKNLSKSHTLEDVCQILNGPKITAFFLNILRPSDNLHVTIDRHAIRIALNTYLDDNQLNVNKNQNEVLQIAYKVAALELNIDVLLLQSSTWEFVRRTNYFNNK